MALIQNIEDPADDLVYKSEHISLHIGDKRIGDGTLYVTETCLMWKPENSAEGISILWKQISLHGISNHPEKCIYIMLDHQLYWEGVYDPNEAKGNGFDENMDNDEDSENDEGHESGCQDEFTEMWLYPHDITAVNQIFQAMSECQALHPDTPDSFSDGSDMMNPYLDHEDDDDFEDDNNEDEVERMRNLNIDQDQVRGA